MTHKQTYLAELAAAARDAVELTKRLQALQWQYWKLNYAPGKAAPITDAEAATVGAVAADVVAAEVAVEAVLDALITKDQIAAFLRIAK